MEKNKKFLSEVKYGVDKVHLLSTKKGAVRALVERKVNKHGKVYKIGTKNITGVRLWI